MTAIGSRIGRYVLVRPSGEAGRWLAFDPALQRRVALELDVATATSEARLAASRSISKLAHPGLVAVHDVGESDGKTFVACEYVAGEPLEVAAVNAGPGDLARWFAELALGLAALHTAGVAHGGLATPAAVSVAGGRGRIGGFVGSRLVESNDAALAEDVQRLRARFAAALRAARLGSRRLSGAFAAIAPEVRAVDLARALVLDRPRRWRAAAAGFAAVGAVIGLVALGRHLALREPPPCVAAGGDLEGVWDDGARARLRAALVDTGSPIAEATAPATLRAIDAWVLRHNAVRAAACTAAMPSPDVGTQLDAAHDAAMICLDRRSAELAALVEVLALADAPMVARAVQAARQLAPVEECIDAGKGEQQLLPTGDPGLRTALAEIDAALAEAHALSSAGLYARAADRLTEWGGGDEAWIDPRRRSQIHRKLGVARAKAGRAAEAIDDLVLAVGLAWQAGSPTLAAEAWADMGFTLAEHLKRPDDALLAIDLGDAAASGTTSPRLRAFLLQTRGVALLVALRHAEARDALDAANTITKALPGEEFVRASILDSLANANLGLRRFDEAEGFYREALALYADILGRDHPAIASVHNNLCAAHYRAGRNAEAVAACLESHRMRVATLGEEHPDTVATLGNYGVLLGAEGRYAEAVVVLEQTLRIRQRILPPASPGVADALVNYGDALVGLGEGARAREAFEDALEIDLATVGEQHFSTTMTLQNLGRALELEGRPTEALAAYERALAIREQLADVLPFSRIDTLVHVVDAAQESGDLVRANEALARIDAISAEHGPVPDFVELIEFARARARVLAGDREAGLADLAALRDRVEWEPLRRRIDAWIVAHRG